MRGVIEDDGTKYWFISFNRGYSDVPKTLWSRDPNRYQGEGSGNAEFSVFLHN